MTIGKKIGLGFAVALVILVVLGAISLWCTWTLITTAHWVSHTHQVLENLEAVLSEIKDSETGQRGFVITGKEPYLEPYNAALKEIDRTFLKLEKLTVDNEKQQERLKALRIPVSEKLKELGESIAARREKGFEAALEIVSNDRGKSYMDEIRSIIETMREAEVKLLNERNDAAEATAMATYLAIGIGTIVAVVLVSLIGTLINRSISGSVHDAIARLSSATAEILASTSQQASGAQEQAAAISQTVATVGQVAQATTQAAERAKGVSEAVLRTLEIGRAGRKAVEDSVAALDQLKEQVESTADSILMLAEQAQAIGEIIATVNDIAEQTNILALNAAIEASRAGEQGRGFGVVAGEVKSLAGQSKKATVQVRQILGEIQRATNTAVLSTETVTKGVAAAIQVGVQTSLTINTLADTLTDTAQASTQITASAGQQATGMAQINKAMQNIDTVARQNQVATRQVEQAAQNLNSLSIELAKLTTG